MVHNIRKTLINIKQMLFSNERVLLTVKQSYLSGVSPDSIVVTNRRIILVHYSFWGLHFGHNLISRTDTHMTELGNVVRTTVHHGALLSTVHIKLRKSTGIEGARKGVWSIAGLSDKGAHVLADGIKDAKAEKRG